MYVRTHETKVGNRLPQLCNMSAAGMQQVCNDSDVVLCHARLASLPRPQLPAGQAPQVVSVVTLAPSFGHVARRRRRRSACSA